MHLAPVEVLELLRELLPQLLPQVLYPLPTRFLRLLPLQRFLKLEQESLGPLARVVADVHHPEMLLLLEQPRVGRVPHPPRLDHEFILAMTVDKDHQVGRRRGVLKDLEESLHRFRRLIPLGSPGAACYAREQLDASRDRVAMEEPQHDRRLQRICRLLSLEQEFSGRRRLGVGQIQRQFGGIGRLARFGVEDVEIGSLDRHRQFEPLGIRGNLSHERLGIVERWRGADLKSQRVRASRLHRIREVRRCGASHRPCPGGWLSFVRGHRIVIPGRPPAPRPAPRPFVYVVGVVDAHCTAARRPAGWHRGGLATVSNCEHLERGVR